jgi:NAD(P)-dependent dehydrogenase (short-subunit alcohol dehydrogenase family)
MLVSDMKAFRYDGKRALVVGGATGMGAAAAKTVGSLGAEVIVMDNAPIEYEVAQAIKVDLRDLASINDVLGQIDGPIHAVFAAAGVADGIPGIMKINFISHRHIIETLAEDGRLGRGGAVCAISSVAGIGWQSNIPLLTEFLSNPDFTSAAEWVDAHEGRDSYMFSKQVLGCYIARQAYPLAAKGIRINGILPGPTDTPLARANADTWLTFAQDYRDATGLPQLVPSQMGDTMAFLNSDGASGISGVTLLVDGGYVMSSIGGTFESGTPVVKFLLEIG